MSNPKYKLTKDGRVVPIASDIEPMPEPVVIPEEDITEMPAEAPEPEPKDELADMFEVPQPEDNDMVTDHLVELDEEDDLSDLTAVSREDIMGTPPKPKYKIVRRGRRFLRREPPPTSLTSPRG